MIRVAFFGSAFAIAMFAHPALADDNQEELVDVATAISATMEPESPTFQMIGVAADDVSRPTSPGKIAVSILNALDQNGNFQNGVALEFRPFLLLRQSELRLSQYQNNDAIRQLSNIQIAMGVAQGASKDDPSVKATLGLIWTPIDGMNQDRISTLSSCLGKVVGDPVPPDAPPTVVEAKKAAQAAAQAVCYKTHPLLPDNTTKLQFNFSPLFVSETGKTSDLKAHGFHTGAVFSIGLTSTKKLVENPDATRGLLVLAASYRKKETTPDPAIEGAFLDRDRLSLGARAVFGRPSFAFLSLQGFYQHAKYSIGQKDDYATFVAGVDVKLSDDFWLTLNAGSSTGRSFGKNETFLGTGLKFGFGRAKKPRVSFGQ
jgi:hypothetical protein